MNALAWPAVPKWARRHRTSAFGWGQNGPEVLLFIICCFLAPFCGFGFPSQFPGWTWFQPGDPSRLRSGGSQHLLSPATLDCPAFGLHPPPQPFTRRPDPEPSRRWKSPNVSRGPFILHVDHTGLHLLFIFRVWARPCSVNCAELYVHSCLHTPRQSIKCWFHTGGGVVGTPPPGEGGGPDPRDEAVWGPGSKKKFIRSALCRNLCFHHLFFQFGGKKIT